MGNGPPAFKRLNKIENVDCVSIDIKYDSTDIALSYFNRNNVDIFETKNYQIWKVLYHKST